MKIIRELVSNVNVSTLKQIYRKGNKIAISFNETTALSDLYTTILDAKGEYSDCANVTYKKGFTTKDKFISAVKGEFVVLEDIYTKECFATIKPFNGKFKDAEATFTLRDQYTGNIADRVVEVSVD